MFDVLSMFWPPGVLGIGPACRCQQFWTCRCSKRPYGDPFHDLTERKSIWKNSFFEFSMFEVVNWLFGTFPHVDSCVRFYFFFGRKIGCFGHLEGLFDPWECLESLWGVSEINFACVDAPNGFTTTRFKKKSSSFFAPSSFCFRKCVWFNRKRIWSYEKRMSS